MGLFRRKGADRHVLMQQVMTYRGHARALAGLGLPLIGSHIAQIAMGITDAVMLGWYDVSALAAETLGFSMYFVLFIVGSGFAFAVMPIVALAIGQGDEQQARRVTRMGLWASAGYGVLVMAPLIWSRPIFEAIGQEPELAALAQTYLRFMAIAMMPSLFVMVFKSYLSALERTQVVLWASVAAAFLNAGLNYILIFGKFGAPELGIAGAGIATAAVSVALAAALAIYVGLAKTEHEVFRRFWRPDGEAFGRVFRMGVPIGLTNLAESGLFAGSALMMGWIGAVALAAHGIALQLTALAFVMHLGLSQAVTVRVGNALGRRDRVHLVRGAVAAIGVSLILSALTIALFLALPETLVSLFVDPLDPEKPAIIAVGVGLMFMAAIFNLGDGGQVMALGLLRGLQDIRVPMIMAALSYWAIGLPMGYVLGFWAGFGPVGIWGGLAGGLFLAGGLMMWRFWWVMLPRVKA